MRRQPATSSHIAIYLRTVPANSTASLSLRISHTFFHSCFRFCVHTSLHLAAAVFFFVSCKILYSRVPVTPSPIETSISEQQLHLPSFRITELLRNMPAQRSRFGLSVLAFAFLGLGQSCLASALKERDMQVHSRHDPSLEIRELDLIQSKTQTQKESTLIVPVGVRKMSDDPSEMFFLEYWHFNSEVRHEAISKALEPILRTEPPQAKAIAHRESSHMDVFSGTTAMDLFPAFLPHLIDDEMSLNLRNLPRESILKRNFQCPTGTNACTSIGEPNSCCATNQVCMKITDTGLGDVGCCPSGQTCSGSVSSCDIARGYTSCPGSSNGGCCIPNYSCQGIGCKFSSNIVHRGREANSPFTGVANSTTVLGAASVLPVATVVPGSTSVVTTTITSANTVVVVVTTLTVVQTQTIAVPTTSSSYLVTTKTEVVTVTDSSSNVYVSTAYTTITTTVAPLVAVRPTSDNPGSTYLLTSTALATSVISVCPGGYYMCSAYYNACCQVGRGCDSASCPALASTSTLTSNGVVIVIVGGSTVSTRAAGTVTVTTTLGGATSAAVQTITASNVVVGAYCAAGWYSCGSNVGGGCCPSGYACGATCSATVAVESSSVPKIAPTSRAVRIGGLRSWMLVGVAVLISAILSM